MTNSCPLCKREFFCIFKQTSSGTLIEEVIVQPKAPDLEQLLAEPELDLANGKIPLTLADDFCYACEQTDRQDDMLVCDHCVRKCCHIQCLQPELDEVPFEPWYCDFCVRDHQLRQLLPTANLFRRQQPAAPRRRQRLRRTIQNNPRVESRRDDRSRGRSSRAQSNRSRSNASISSRNYGARRQQSRREVNENRSRIRLGTLAGPPSRPSSNEVQRDDRNTIRFTFNRDFQHVERSRRQPRSRARQQSPQENFNAGENIARNNTTPVRLGVSRVQFGNRATLEEGANQVLFQRQDLEAFANEFNQRQTNGNQRSNSGGDSALRVPSSSENFF